MLDVTIKKASSSTLTETVCNSFMFGGNTLTKSGTYMDTLTAFNGCDSVITLKLIVNKSTSSTLTQSACKFYVFGGKTLTTSGTYNDTIPNKAGCDSMITLNLTINTINDSVTLNLKTLTAAETGATYQWVDCDSSNTAIAGATSQSFVATKIGTGHYAVVISKNGCTDTSVCTAVTVSGISETSNKRFTVYPNPSSAQVTVSGISKFNHAGIRLTDMTGKLLFVENNICGVDFKLNISEYSSGIYMLEVMETGIVSRIKIIKE